MAVTIVATGGISRAHDRDAAQRWSDARAVPTVQLVAVDGAGAADALTLPGTLQAWNAAKLYARVNGYMKSWSRDIGDRVPAGAALGLIDTPELDQQIAQARADLASAKAGAELAQSTADRWNDLLSTASVSRQEADEKNGALAARRAAVLAAEANLGRLLAMKSFATLRAPFAGTVTLRSVDIGDLVGTGSGQQPLFAVADTRKVRVYVNVPQGYAAEMKPGLTAELSLPDYPGRRFPARLIGNSGAIDGRTGAFQVQLAADNADGALKPGGYAQVRFDVRDGGDAVRVPASALLFRAEGTQVALVDADGRVRLRPVTIGRDLGQSVIIAAGLTARDKVVDNPPDSLAEGEKVRLLGPARG
ncbi:efflux RND transporter periplasmic adaptor subunit [Sphingomonas quercus]|uniref:efflux RND transporter periplasmic adaptor subunit n=1 Tax=Sphingomonas quercus TaxID=2842451 RepID=UPI00341D4D93